MTCMLKAINFRNMYLEIYEIDSINFRNMYLEIYELDSARFFAVQD